MENGDSTPLADIVTFVVVVGVFLVIAGIFMIPELSEAGAESGKLGITVDPQAPNVELGLHRLQNNQALPGAVVTVGLEQVIAQPGDCDGSDE